ncbi:uncharacterized protein LOC122523326 [Polistes fuscatus]|uniref:uncharacterized protein LOC122523326 n=1 Tax=Polistes fuscatus TaxID=30207 RepID=UPI001CA95C48|nr:uncharacterized protein LOC122523326 [Polistes fuscatus]
MSWIMMVEDGTRITTGYKIEERPLICDWTRDEFERYFGSIKLYEHDDRLFKVNSGNNNSNNDEDGMGDVIDNNNKNKNNNNNNGNDKDNYNDEKFLWQDDEPLNGEDRYQDEMTRILIADGFVSVLLTSLFEHKNYASVSYDQSAVSCTLSMPTDLRVSISRRGHYEVSAPGKVNLKIPKVKPTNADRKDLVRSTYSIPYDWLFPFGRNGHGICNDTYDMPLAKTTKRRPPRTLRLRVLHGFKEPDRNAIIDLQKAMASYWRYLVDNIDECERSFYVYDGVQPKLVEDDYRTWKDNIREFALGIRTNIDVATYLDSLQRCRRKVSMTKAEPKSKKLFELLKLRRANEIQLELHKRCIREKIILPYFENVVGTCFLLIINCLDQAILIIDKKEKEEEEEEEEVENDIF